jgi:adenine-specific DNA-methyltransferase
LRGNRWYVRVQVPTSMQDRLERKEFWVSLKTSDRSVAVGRAATATQKKRWEIGSTFRQLSENWETSNERDFNPRSPAVRETHTGGCNKFADQSQPHETEKAGKRKGRRYDGLSKGQLIELLEKQDRTKKLGLVWERDFAVATKALDCGFTVAQIDVELSDGPDPWDNLVIEGDNYDALRWLRMTHRGRVKCIYIDPPYNTGNMGWVYNDRYRSAGDRFHQSAWLEFLYRRLELARDLLAEDGVILVSINDENRAVLELMMHEALPRLRVGSFVWRTRNGSNTDQKGYLSPDHEHILVAGKKAFSFSGTEKSYATYSNPDDDIRGNWQAVPMKLGFSKDERPNLYYPLQDPTTGIYYPCNPDSVWRFATRARVSRRRRLQTQPIEDFIEQGRIKFPTNQRVEMFETIEDLEAAIDRKDVPLSGGVPILRRDLPDLAFWVGKKIGFGTPTRKLFKSELKRSTKPLSSWVSGTSELVSDIDDNNQITAGSYTEGSRDIRNIFGFKAFNYAKPVSLIRELTRQTTSANDLVLDFFAGSATTAQAVMELNAEDGANRRFIMVSSTEATAADSGKNLCRDATAERVRLLNASDDKKYASLCAGFAYLRTKQINFENLDYDLEPSDAWTCLEALHGLPLTSYDPDQPWNFNVSDDVTLVLVDRFDQALIEWLQPRSSQNIFVYAWAKGPFTQQLDAMNIHVSLVVESLVEAFKQDASG